MDKTCLNFSLVFLSAAFILQACALNPPVVPDTSGSVEGGVVQVPTRDEVMGANQARSSVKAKSNQEYLFRNVVSAFPDNGKNMLLQKRALSKKEVKGAVDNSPRQIKIYQDPERLKANKERFSNSNKAFYATPLTQKEASLLSQSPKKEDSREFFYQADSPPHDRNPAVKKDDIFEPNNEEEKAFDISNAEEMWLGLLGSKGAQSEGIQADEDWFKIAVSPHYRRLVLDLRFQHYLGDVDMKLHDSKGNLIATSQGLGEDEFINVVLDNGGTYFIQIYGSNRSNRYDLKFSTHFTGGGDDEYEDNDTLKSAYDLRSAENRWLSEIQGEGVAADDDYYMIRVPAGKERVQLDLRYYVSRGDVDVRLLNTQGKVIASSAHIGDDDFIDFTVPSAGTYWIKIYPFAPHVTFNLYDLKVSFLKPSQKDTTKLSSR